MRILEYKIDLEELKKEKERNHKSNLAFIDFYVEYMKKHTNKEWSRQQNRLINSIYKYPRKKRR